MPKACASGFGKYRVFATSTPSQRLIISSYRRSGKTRSLPAKADAAFGPFVRRKFCQVFIAERILPDRSGRNP
jgi:hypothetical protein